MTTPNLGLQELVSAQVRPDLTVNSALRLLDAMANITVTGMANSPPAVPFNGECYIVGPSPGGAWAGQADSIAVYDLPALMWRFIAPKGGWIAYNHGDSPPGYYYYDATNSPAQWAVLLDTSAPPLIPDGGALGEGLAKVSDVDGDAGWSNLQATAAPTMEKRNAYFWCDDFLHKRDTNTNNEWDGTALQAGAGWDNDANEAGHPGIIRLNSGSTNTGSVHMVYGSISGGLMWMGGGEVVWDGLIKVSDVPTAGEQFVMNVGLGSSLTTSVPTKGVYFSLNVSTGVWAYVTGTAAGVLTTVADSGGLVVVANTWTHLRVVVEAAGANAKFYVDGSLRATITTTIPTATGVSPMAYLRRNSNGSTMRRLSIDVMACAQSITTSRWT